MTAEYAITLPATETAAPVRPAKALSAAFLRERETPIETKQAILYAVARSPVVYGEEALRLPKLSPALYVWLTHCQKMMFVGEGALISIPAIIGRLVGMKAEIRDSQRIGSSVSGLMHDAKTVFLCRYA